MDLEKGGSDMQLIAGHESASTEAEVAAACDVSPEDGLFSVPLNASSNAIFSFCQAICLPYISLLHRIATLVTGL